jgi:LysM repeat protein
LADDALLALWRSAQQSGDFEEARKNYEVLLALYPASPLTDEVKQELEKLTTPSLPESVRRGTIASPTVYEVEAGDTLGKIARKFGITVRPTD